MNWSRLGSIFTLFSFFYDLTFEWQSFNNKVKSATITKKKNVDSKSLYKIDDN